MELLNIKRGQKKTGLLIGEQQAKLVKIAAQRPEDKRRDIGTWIQKSSKSMARSAETFGIAVDQKPAAVNGRLLPAPVIEYSQPSHYYAGTTGAWNMKDVCPLSTTFFCALLFTSAALYGFPVLLTSLTVTVAMTRTPWIFLLDKKREGFHA